MPGNPLLLEMVADHIRDERLEAARGERLLRQAERRSEGLRGRILAAVRRLLPAPVHPRGEARSANAPR